MECSNIAEQSKQIIKDNNLEGIVEVIHSKIEEIQELPGGIEKVRNKKTNGMDISN